MPNQLAKSKRRQSLAEHEAVLAALAEIARREGTTVMALLREAARDLVRRRAAMPGQTEALGSLVWRMAPRMNAWYVGVSGRTLGAATLIFNLSPAGKT